MLSRTPTPEITDVIVIPLKVRLEPVRTCQKSPVKICAVAPP
jgi:hypothetical protein